MFHFMLQKFNGLDVVLWRFLFCSALAKLFLCELYASKIILEWGELNGKIQVTRLIAFISS